MDVQAAASSASATATLPPISIPPSGVSVPTLSDVTDAAPAPVIAPAAPSGGTSTGSSPAPTTSVGTFPAPASAAPKTLSSDVSKLLDASGSGTQVSFRIATGTDQTVVVVTDKATGKTIVQFPSETLIALAQFFDKLDGSVVDKKV